jgi:hypothetical protein
MLEWLYEADFTKEVNLCELARHPFQANEEEMDEFAEMPSWKFIKLLKM